jgi:hypothetical protein
MLDSLNLIKAGLSLKILADEQCSQDGVNYKISVSSRE